MIDTTTHSFNHCGGGGGGAVSSAASVIGSNGSSISSNSGSDIASSSNHLNSEQDHHHYQAAQLHHHYNHNHLNSYGATVHPQQHHQLTELNSISDQHRLAKYSTSANATEQSARFSHEKLASIKQTDDDDEPQQQFFYTHQNQNLSHEYHSSCWPQATTNNSWPKLASENKTAPANDRQSFSSNQWQQEPSSTDTTTEDSIVAEQAKRRQLDNIYALPARRGAYSPLSARAACVQSAPYHQSGHTAVLDSDEHRAVAYADIGGGDDGDDGNDDDDGSATPTATKDKPAQAAPTAATSSSGNEFTQSRILEMRKEKSRDAARSRRSKENHEFYELAKLLPLPAAITSQLDFLDKASIIRLTISFLKLRQFSVNGHPPWAPDFATLGSVNPYSSQANYALDSQQYPNSNTQQQQQQQDDGTSVKHQPIVISPAQTPSSNNRLTHSNNLSYASSSSSSSLSTPSSIVAAFPNNLPVDPYNGGSQRTTVDCQQSRSGFVSFSEPKHNNNNYHKNASSLFDIHQGTHILQSLDGFAFAIGRDGRFLYISETVSMYLGLSQVEMTGSSVFDYTHQQDHEELARHLGIQNPTKDSACDASICISTRSASVHSQYSAASNETLIDDYVNHHHTGSSGGVGPQRKRLKTSIGQPQNNHSGAATARGAYGSRNIKKLTNSGVASKAAIKIEANTSDNVDTQHAGGLHELGSGGAKEMLDDSSGVEDNSLQGTEEDPLVRQFCIRMKSTLTKRGCQHFKSSGYRVVHVVAHLRSYQSNDHGHLMDPLDEPAGAALPTTGSTKQAKRRGPKSCSSSSANNKQDAATSNKQESIGKNNDNDIAELQTNPSERLSKPKIIGMVAVAIALPPPSINELRLDSDTFVLRLSLDLKITHIEPRITELLHYPVELIAGRSLYSLIHPADAYQVQKCHKDLLTKGQMMSGYYRLLARDGGYIWIQTCATLICNNNNLSGQVAPMILPQSPSSTVGGIPMTPLSAGPERQQMVTPKLPGYLAPTILSGSNSNSNTKLLQSPGMSSHISSNYDNLDQDQCVIFVNYMITNVIESEEMIDICQSQDFSPLNQPFAGITNSSSHTLYNSPSSSCSSPCISSLKSANNNNNNNNSNTPSYVQSTTPISANMTPPSHRRQAISHNERSKDNKSNNRRQTSSKVAKSSSSVAYIGEPSDENGQSGTYNKLVSIPISDNNNSDNQQRQLEVGDEIPSESNGMYGSYHHHYSAPGSVNLALNNNKIQATGVSDNHWLSTSNQQHRAATSGLDGTSAAAAAAATTMVYGSSQGSDHYSVTAAMDRSSIYKAAFGLNVSAVAGTGVAATANYGTSASSHHHHHHNQHQPAAVYASSTGQVAAYGSATSAAPAAVCNTWDNAAAVAAVAAASNLTGHHHHHHHVAGNPYAHLEPHHHHHLHHNPSHNHHHQAAAAAAAAAAHSLSTTNPHNHHHTAASHHHQTSAGNYYNYYGYYGNKFI